MYVLFWVAWSDKDDETKGTVIIEITQLNINSNCQIGLNFGNFDYKFQSIGALTTNGIYYDLLYKDAKEILTFCLTYVVSIFVV